MDVSVSQPALVPRRLCVLVLAGLFACGDGSSGGAGSSEGDGDTQGSTSDETTSPQDASTSSTSSTSAEGESSSSSASETTGATAVDDTTDGSETGVDPVCGDGVIDGDEVCDDANAVDGDGCDGDCTFTDFQDRGRVAAHVCAARDRRSVVLGDVLRRIQRSELREPGVSGFHGATHGLAVRGPESRRHR